MSGGQVMGSLADQACACGCGQTIGGSGQFILVAGKIYIYGHHPQDARAQPEGLAEKDRTLDKPEPMIVLPDPNWAVCGYTMSPWYGWLFRKHPDGTWISVEKLATVPMVPRDHPLTTIANEATEKEKGRGQ